MMEYGNVGMLGKQNASSGRGTRLRALDEQTLVPPKRVLSHYSNIPSFQYSSNSIARFRVEELRDGRVLFGEGSFAVAQVVQPHAAEAFVVAQRLYGVLIHKKGLSPLLKRPHIMRGEVLEVNET
jgi:hypothetical protein